jgi:hypothetical protein
MKNDAFALVAVAAASLALSSAALLPAQTELPPPKEESAEKSEMPIPNAALLTQRGRELAQELRMLRRTRDTMGSKHPTRPLIEQKIEAVEEQLQAWEPAFGNPPPNPFQPGGGQPGGEADAPQMNEYDLRQMVIRLTKRVEELERRVSQLERAAQ